MRPRREEAKAIETSDVSMHARQLIATDILLTLRRYLHDKQLNGEIVLDMTVKATVKSLRQALHTLTQQGYKRHIGENQLECINVLLQVVDPLIDDKVKRVTRISLLANFLQHVGSKGTTRKMVISSTNRTAVQLRRLNSIAGKSKLARQLERLAHRIKAVLANNQKDMVEHRLANTDSYMLLQLRETSESLTAQIAQLKADIRELGATPCKSSAIVSTDSRPQPHMDGGKEERTTVIYHPKQRVNHKTQSRIAIKLAMTAIDYLSAKKVNVPTMLEQIGAGALKPYHIPALQSFLIKLEPGTDGHVKNNIKVKHRTFLRMLAETAEQVNNGGITFAQLKQLRDVLRNAGKVNTTQYETPTGTVYRLSNLRGGRGKSELATSARDLAFDLENEVINSLDVMGLEKTAHSELHATVMMLEQKHAALKAQYSELLHQRLFTTAHQLAVSVRALVASASRSRMEPTHTPQHVSEHASLDGKATAETSAPRA